MRNIFIHGLGQTPQSWDRTLELLNLQDTVCPNLPDLLPFDSAAYPELYTAFTDLCDKTPVKLNLCGLSLGGILALNYAIDRPERVNSLILIAAQYRMPKALLKFQNLLFGFMPAKQFESIGFTKAGMINLCASMAELDFTERLNRITCPTLVVIGEKDSSNRKAAHELGRRIKGAELVTVSKAGHGLNIEAADDLAGIISGFYK